MRTTPGQQLFVRRERVSRLNEGTPAAARSMRAAGTARIQRQSASPANPSTGSVPPSSPPDAYQRSGTRGELLLLLLLQRRSLVGREPGSDPRPGPSAESPDHFRQHRGHRYGVPGSSSVFFEIIASLPRTAPWSTFRRQLRQLGVRRHPVPLDAEGLRNEVHAAAELRGVRVGLPADV